MLHLGGCGQPEYLDGIPLPELGIPVQSTRGGISGFLSNGCMHFDGEWKLVKYASGEMLLFNLLEDPMEQRNRIDEGDCQSVYRRLDAELTRQLLDSTNAGHHEKQVAHTQLYNEEDFGKRGWQRSYPLSIRP